MMMKEMDVGKRIAVLRSAIHGETWAQQMILQHFDGYITTLSAISRERKDTTINVDEDIKVQLQLKLLQSLDSFDLEGILTKEHTSCTDNPLQKDIGIGG